MERQRLVALAFELVTIETLTAKLIDPFALCDVELVVFLALTHGVIELVNKRERERERESERCARYKELNRRTIALDIDRYLVKYCYLPSY